MSGPRFFLGHGEWSSLLNSFISKGILSHSNDGTSNLEGTLYFCSALYGFSKYHTKYGSQIHPLFRVSLMLNLIG